jgi:flagellar basal body-associated protein FliL
MTAQTLSSRTPVKGDRTVSILWIIIVVLVVLALLGFVGRGRW